MTYFRLFLAFLVFSLNSFGQISIAPNNKPITPYSQVKDFYTLNYDGENYSGIGSGSYPVEVSACFTTLLTAPLTGGLLKWVRIYFYDIPESAILKIYGQSIGSPGPLLLSQVVTGPITTGWNEITLTTPITITGEDLWVGFLVAGTDTTYPPGIDAGPANPNGDWIKDYYSSWVHLSSYGFNSNWNIRAIVDYESEITVTSPDGGENWPVGSIQTITWTSSNVSDVKIEYTTDLGSTWITEISSTPSDGNYSWTIPSTPSSNCKVKITNVSNTSINDQSNNPFSIIQPSINVTVPNGGESWLVGSTQNINWTSSNIINVKLEYTTNSGTNWIQIIASTPASAGSYSWTVPNTPSTLCKVRISDVTNSSINDLSNNVFTISSVPSITVTSPNGGESWIVGSSYNITWASENVSDVKIEYTTDLGSTWITEISSTPSDGNYSWTIPSTPSSNCKVKITNVSNTSINDQSNNPFSIIQPSINVTVPNGGESWLVGSTQNINWTSSNVSDVKIDYSINSGVSWITVISSTPSSGSYAWTIPNTPSNNCRVKISNVDNLSVYDQSDNDFSIVQPLIAVNSPDGGEGWQIETVHNITWSSSNVSNVKIEYTTNNGSSWSTVIGSTLSDGIYEWTIPNTPSTQCKVKVSDISNPVIYDESNTTFSIIQFIFYANIQADSIWIDTDYDGLELGLVSGSESYISQGTITTYEWYVNNELVSNGITSPIELITGTSIVKLIVYSNTGLSTSDSMYISVYSAKLSTSGAILSGTSQYGNNFYVTSMNNGVYRIDSTGTILQSYITGGSMQSSLCISNQTGLMYVGSSDARLYCFDINLNSIWDKGLGGVVNNSASVNYNGDVVYIGANDNNTHLGFLKSLVASNGNPKWTFQADGMILSSPVVLEVVDSNDVVLRNIIYFGTSKGTVYAVDDLGDSYNLFWSETINPDSAFVSSPAISEDGMIYIGSKNGYLYRFTWDGNHQASWKKFTGGAIISSPIIDENKIVYIASGGGHIYGFDKYFTFNSDPLKIFYQNTGINGTAGIGPDGTLLVGCDNGKFFALDKNVSGTDMPVKWYFQATGPVLSPALVTNNGIVYIGSTSGDVFIMRDPGIGGKRIALTSYEWPTFKGDNQRSKVVKLVSNVTSVEDGNNVTADFNLFQNFPNPYNSSSVIKYSIPKSSQVTLKIFNTLGEELETLVNEEKQIGTYELTWNAVNLPSGVYFYRLQAGSFTQTRKMILLK